MIPPYDLPLSPLSYGMRGPEVGNWQRFLNSAGIAPPLIVDEDFGRFTRVATSEYQTREAVPEIGAGIVGPLTRKRALSQGFIPFVQARNYTPASPGSRKIDLLVIHTMESPDKPDTAERVAAWFAGPDAPQASAHYCVDVDSVVQCVRNRDVAWQAENANRNGIGIEHAGYARQTAEDWKSPYNQAMLSLSAKLASRLCKEYNIPIERPQPTTGQVLLKGIYGHVDVTNYLNGGKGHTDPGPNFPWYDYLALIRANS